MPRAVINFQALRISHRRGARGWKEVGLKERLRDPKVTLRQ